MTFLGYQNHNQGEFRVKNQFARARIVGRLLLAVACVSGGLLAISKAFAAGETMFHGTVTKISDGDTIKFRNGSARKNANPMTIRLVGIDTAETYFERKSQGYWGEEAKRQLENMIPINTPISVRSSELDKYGRALGTIYASDVDINLKMVRLGFAIPYFICSGIGCNKGFLERERVAEYFEACDEARDNERGIFDPSNPLELMPFEFRLKVKGERHKRHVGDYDTRKLHSPSDYKQIDVCRRVFFDDADDASAVGFQK